jgi:GPI-anchor transamidase subunit U
VQEGAHLYENEVDPYQGDVFHENPLVLIGGSFLLKNFAGFMHIFFILLDLCTAVFIFYGTKNIAKKNVSKTSLIRSEFSPTFLHSS